MVICSVPGCGKKHEAHGYCRSHYRSLQRWGDPLRVDINRINRNKQKFDSLIVLKGQEQGIEKRKNMSTEGSCSVQDCTRPIKAKGLCDMHHQRLRRNGKLTIKRKSFDVKTCLVFDCNKPHKSHGYCAYHSTLFRETGTPYRAKVVRYCGVKGCNNIHIAKGLCKYHYSKWRNVVDEHGLETET